MNQEDISTQIWTLNSNFAIIQIKNHTVGVLMLDDIQKMVEEIRDTKKDCTLNIVENMSDYIYRAKRYGVNFSIAIVYSNIALDITASKIEEKLRHTDRIVCIKHNLLCVVFDAIEENFSLKAAENLFTMLKAIDYHADYYIATIFSKNFEQNYLNMLNKLFERVEYSVSHGMSDIVDDEDFLI